MWALCLFVLPFRFAIAVLKDVPDIEGDRRFRSGHSPCGSAPERVPARHGGTPVAYGGMILIAPLVLA